MSQAIDRLRQLLDDAQRLVVFTGAGISTESGIPDFRSPGTGLWTKIKPIMFDDFVASESVRQESWARRFDGDRKMESARPNKGHEAVFELVRRGTCGHVITQNVDNLHQDSGIDPATIIELHGNATYASCLSCGARYEMADLEAQYRSGGRVEPCAACGGIVKSATISFGQAMPEAEMRRAQAATEACDLFMVIGSSLSVYPAAGFPELAKRLGAGLVILNRDETPLDPIADLVVHEEIGQALSFAVGIN
ncbi:MAG: Sir2 family NAD-dependent protein deacetylase [Pseudomonadota bacterium]